MTAQALSLLFSFALVLLPTAALGQSEPANKEHPGVVALSKDSGGVWAYKSFPQLTTLYTSQRDSRGKSGCDERCSSIWPPLAAGTQETGKKVGNWSVINRSDGRSQWAYKGQPVYMRFHDMPADPHAMEVEGFRPLKP